MQKYHTNVHIVEWTAPITESRTDIGIVIVPGSHKEKQEVPKSQLVHLSHSKGHYG